MGLAISTAYPPADSGGQFKVVFVRHGLSQNNVMGQVGTIGYGVSGCSLVKLPHHCDAPLTLPGRHQATSVGELLGQQSAALDLYHRQIFCSDMARAIGTAGYMTIGWRRESPQSPQMVVPLPFFAEMSSSGNCVVRHQDEHLQEAWGCTVDYCQWEDDTWKHSQRCAGDFGKSVRQWHAEVLPWLHTRVHSHTGGKVPVVVCHGRYIRHMLGMWGRLANTQPVLATYDLGARRFVDFEVLQPRRQQCAAKGGELLAKSDRKRLDPVAGELLDDVPSVAYHVYPATPHKL